MPFITILTRVHPARPRCLKRCLKSVRAQTDQDFQHLLLRPRIEPHDIIKVGPLIHEASPQIRGRYVMQLPDDDVFRKLTFIADLKALIGADDVDMVIFRMKYGSQIMPSAETWQAREIKRGKIAGQNVILKREIYDGASHEWLRPDYGADFYYIQTALSLSKKVIWWNYVGEESQGNIGANMGRPEKKIKLKKRFR